MVLTDFPPINFLPNHFRSSEPPTGKFISNDNYGDSGVILVAPSGGRENWKWVWTFRSGDPGQGRSLNGCQYHEKPFGDGDLFGDWGLVTGPGINGNPGLETPWKAFITSTINNKTNIDTSTPFYLGNATGGPCYFNLNGVKPGPLVGEEGGLIHAIQMWQSTAPSRLPTDWTGPPLNTYLINPLDHTSATWAQPWVTEIGPPASYDGGTKEQSVVYDYSDDKVRIFFEGVFHSEPEWNGGSILHHAMGRATSDRVDWGFGLHPTMTWDTPESSTSYVWRPKEDGMKASQTYGTTNESAVWGTSERVSPRAHVSIEPHVNPATGTPRYHMVLQQKKPNTGGGKENNTSGVGHWWSDEQGAKGSWVADSRNPILTWNTPGLGLEILNGQANKMNSPFLVWHPNGSVVLCLHANGTKLGVNKPGTKCYGFQFFYGTKRGNRRRGKRSPVRGVHSSNFTRGL